MVPGQAMSGFDDQRLNHQYLTRTVKMHEKETRKMLDPLTDNLLLMLLQCIIEFDIHQHA